MQQLVEGVGRQETDNPASGWGIGAPLDLAPPKSHILFSCIISDWSPPHGNHSRQRLDFGKPWLPLASRGCVPGGLGAAHSNGEP